MTRRSGRLAAVGLIATGAMLGTLHLAAVSSQSAIEFNLCDLVWFADETPRGEYQQLVRKLGLSPDYRAAIDEQQKARQQLAQRLPDELAALWKRVQADIADAVRSEEAAETQEVLADHCLTRLRRDPYQHIQAVRTDTAATRSLLAAPDSTFQRDFRIKLDARQNALGSPAALNQAIRIQLGLPVPH
jgi:hypothetical protein